MRTLYYDDTMEIIWGKEGIVALFDTESNLEKIHIGNTIEEAEQTLLCMGIKVKLD